jgi:hypothetical protein
MQEVRGKVTGSNVISGLHVCNLSHGSSGNRWGDGYVFRKQWC